MNSTDSVPFVQKNYHTTKPKLSATAIERETNNLKAIRISFPQTWPLDVEHAWRHLNDQLQKNGIKTRIVFETDLAREKATQAFLQRPLEQVFGAIVEERKIRNEMGTWNCNVLLGVIIENTNLQILFRENEIILSNYVTSE